MPSAARLRNFDAAKEIWPTAVFFRSPKKSSFFLQKTPDFLKKDEDNASFQLSETQCVPDLSRRSKVKFRCITVHPISWVPDRDYL